MRSTIIFEAITGSLGETVRLTRDEIMVASKSIAHAIQIAARLSRASNKIIILTSTDDILNGVAIISNKGRTLLCGLQLGIIVDCDPISATAKWPETVKIRAFKLSEKDFAEAVKGNGKDMRKLIVPTSVS